MTAPKSGGKPGDSGIVNVIGWALDWFSLQFVSTDWIDTGAACKQMADNIQDLDLTEVKYFNPVTKDYAHWSASRHFKDVVRDTAKYCQAVADVVETVRDPPKTSEL